MPAYPVRFERDSLRQGRRTRVADWRAEPPSGRAGRGGKRVAASAPSVRLRRGPQTHRDVEAGAIQCESSGPHTWATTGVTLAPPPTKSVRGRRGDAHRAGPAACVAECAARRHGVRHSQCVRSRGRYLEADFYADAGTQQRPAIPFPRSSVQQHARSAAFLAAPESSAEPA